MRRFPRSDAIVAVILGLAASTASGGDGPPTRPDLLARPEGAALSGTFLGDLRDGFRFEPKGGAAAIPIGGPAEVVIGGQGPSPTAGIPPIQLVLGRDQRVSGQLLGLDEATVRLVDGPGGRPLTVGRPGVLAIRQRPGEALILADEFETLDPGRWSTVGDPRVEDGPHTSGRRSLRLGADGSALTARLAEPVERGRLEVAFRDDGAVVPGAQWFLDLLFRGEGGPETIRAVLGWSEESLAVQASGGARPSLGIQRLARKPGWHRLEVQFGPEAELSVDGNALASGKGPSGPLIEVRLGTSLSGDRPATPAAAYVDDLRLVRLAAVGSAGEADPGQDEVRLLEGEQVFGNVREGDGRRVIIDVLGERFPYPWSQVASVEFRREAKPSREVDGLLCRVEWRSAPGNDPRDLDRAEGAITRADAAAFTLETPYAGTLVIPRDLIRRLVVEGRGRRLVVDPTAHHLGDSIARAPELLDPPQFEGGLLERAFPLKEVPGPGKAATLVLDVLQVVGEFTGAEHSHLVKAGEIRTKVALNGKDFDYINRYVTTRNDEPERLRIPIPAGLLKAGENRLRLISTGRANDPNYFDDIGVLGIAVDIQDAPSAKP